MPSAIADRYQELVDTASDITATRIPEDAHVEIQVGNATCENAAGSRALVDEFRKHIASTGRQDIIIREVGCTGRCSCEPIVGISLPGQAMVKYQKVDRDAAHRLFTSHVLHGEPVHELILDHQSDHRSHSELFVCGGQRCPGCTSTIDLVPALRERLAAAGLNDTTVRIIESNCLGMCTQTGKPGAGHMLVMPAKVVYRLGSEDDLDDIIEKHLKQDQIVEHLRVAEEPLSQRFFDLYGDQSFFNRQTRLALRNSGIIDPASLSAYLGVGGFSSLARLLDIGDPQVVIDEVTKSNLRGRGGGGFPTGIKWGIAKKENNPVKYLICNADEGDPGAFMDRSMLESDPFSILEGMLIGAYGIGATAGFIYCRAEYPLAIKRLENAIEKCEEAGILGEHVLGSDFAFSIEIRLGAGAFVCGEETALIHSIEGKRGEPRIRPPYPSTSGLFGKPTVINNVETFANIPVVLQYGSSWFKRVGTEKSGGTKVFALAGKVSHTGLVEVPMGTTLRQIVCDIGGGVPDDKALKAIQTGGPAGGCIPEQFLDTPVDFDTLGKLGSIMGSGGMIVMDEDECMVDIAKYFLTFSQDESCGKCTPCREGTKRMLEILERITVGNGTLEDLDKLERLGKLSQRSSLCGLGRAAPNPVLSTLKYFRDEYIAHVTDKKCPAHKCTSLVHYHIDEDACVGCTLCARKCPTNCISGKRKELHIIDQTQCIKCGQCYEVCRFGAVTRS